MNYELDHIFVCASVDAPEAAHLITFGMDEGPPNEHPGQGTANRRFFFQNAMLELLWVRNESEAKSDLTRPTKLWERWEGRRGSACPFGICFRPTGDTAVPPFTAWEYHPNYLPEPLHIDMATSTDRIAEPMLFYLPFGRRRAKPPLNPYPVKHGCGFREISRVEVASPNEDGVSMELKTVMDAGFLSVRTGNEYLMEIGFDHEVQGKRKDFRPYLPLILSW